MDYSLMFPSKYVKAADLGGRQVTLVIASVAIADLEGSDGTSKQKGVVTFENAKKAWILNRTCAEACKLMWGKDTDDWIGHKITLYAQKMADPFGGGEIEAIRVAGSPELKEAKSATVQRGRKTIKVNVRPTAKANGKANGKTAPAKAAPKPEPTPEPEAEGEEEGGPDDPATQAFEAEYGADPEDVEPDGLPE